MQHCYASCRIKEELGSFCAWGAGWGRELKQAWTGLWGAGRVFGLHGFELGDIWNNWNGRSCANDSRGCMECCKDKALREIDWW